VFAALSKLPVTSKRPISWSASAVALRFPGFCDVFGLIYKEHAKICKF
jgi:hypothetical protein